MKAPPRKELSATLAHSLLDLRAVERVQERYKFPDPCASCGGFIGYPHDLEGLGVLFKTDPNDRNLHRALCLCPIRRAREWQERNR